MFRLTDVPWDQALDIVLKQNQLRGELQGNILRIATAATLQSEDTARKAALDAKDAISPLETHTYILNYTKAGVVQTTLTQGTSSVVSKRGDISKDDRKNALIITDIPGQFAKIDQIIGSWILPPSRWRSKDDCFPPTSHSQEISGVSLDCCSETEPEIF